MGRKQKMTDTEVPHLDSSLLFFNLAFNKSCEGPSTYTNNNNIGCYNPTILEFYIYDL